MPETVNRLVELQWNDPNQRGEIRDFPVSRHVHRGQPGDGPVDREPAPEQIVFPQPPRMQTHQAKPIGSATQDDASPRDPGAARMSEGAKHASRERGVLPHRP